MSEQLVFSELITSKHEEKGVKVHSAGIHIEHKMTVTQRKAWFYMLFKAFQAPEDQDLYQITIRELAEAIGCQATNLKRIKETLEGMVGITVRWDIFGKVKENDPTEQKVWGAAALLADCEVFPFSGICEYSFSTKMKRRILQPSMFVKLNLLVTKGFTSKNSLAIYCLALDYLVIRDNYGEKNLTVEEIRQLLGLEPGKYERVVDLHRHILKKAESDINKQSDMQISITPIKTGKRITKFKLRMSIKPEHLAFYRRKSETMLLPAPEAAKAYIRSEMKKIEDFHPELEPVQHFFEEHSIRTYSDPFKRGMEALVNALGADQIQHYLLFVVEYVQEEVAKSQERHTPIRSVSGFFVNQMAQPEVLQKYMRKKHQKEEAEQQQREAAKQKELKVQRALDSQLASYYQSDMRQNLKDHILADFHSYQDTLATIWETKTNDFYKRYVQKKHGADLNQEYLNDHTFMMELLGHADDFGFQIEPFEDWKPKYVAQNPEKVQDALENAVREVEVHKI